MKNLVLASSSPRRKQILQNMGLVFTIQPSTYDEHLDNDIFSYEKIEKLAKNKALSIIEDCPNSIIISADTVVVLDNKILGKPKDEKEAFIMLSQLSDRTHFVVTSICVLNSETEEIYTTSTTSYVTFCKLTDEMINNYIKTSNPLDKAGSYGIQELGSDFIKKTEGSFENIVGLCPNALKKALHFCKVM